MRGEVAVEHLFCTGSCSVQNVMDEDEHVNLVQERSMADSSNYDIKALMASKAALKEGTGSVFWARIMVT